MRNVQRTLAVEPHFADADLSIRQISAMPAGHTPHRLVGQCLMERPPDAVFGDERLYTVWLLDKSHEAEKNYRCTARAAQCGEWIVTSGGGDGNPSWFGACRLGKLDLKDAVRNARLDVLRIDVVGDRETAREVADVVLGA